MKLAWWAVPKWWVSLFSFYPGHVEVIGPPCTEGVIWTIVNKVRSVSKCQLELLREAGSRERRHGEQRETTSGGEQATHQHLPS
ncbi:hypothetical protein BDA96_07G166200 [Sorghum bicolor]|uniref:Alpha-carbonic anhydrase domain-containing protein n=2 Tax=Sorghum bicolor TaxID=4558 RepID=A0A921QLQ9_SORBI|nr:hypothetical protein BDA96_07G166200 [Sorghum bicolor]OQU80626.1 hypothetical protein SORBI_3007G155050 [Sorghum bicolor]